MECTTGVRPSKAVSYNVTRRCFVRRVFFCNALAKAAGGGQTSTPTVVARGGTALEATNRLLIGFEGNRRHIGRGELVAVAKWRFVQFQVVRPHHQRFEMHHVSRIVRQQRFERTVIFLALELLPQQHGADIPTSQLDFSCCIQ